jgi:hypothetical protein
VGLLGPAAPPAADEGAQDATAQICLYLGHSGLIDSTGRVKDDTRHFLKHPIDHAYMEVHMSVQAGTKLGCVVVALAIELTGTCQLKPGLEVLGYGLVEQRALGMARVVKFGLCIRLPGRV